MDMHQNCHKIFEANSPFTYFDHSNNNIVITTKNFIADYQIAENKVAQRWVLDNPNFFSSQGIIDHEKNEYVVIENKHIIKHWTNMDKDINLYGKLLSLRDLSLQQIYYISTLGLYIITHKGNILPYGTVENKLNHGGEFSKEDGNINVITSFKCTINNLNHPNKHYIVLLCQGDKDEIYITINGLVKDNVKCVKKIWLDEKIKLKQGTFDIVGNYDYSHYKEEINLTIGFGSTLISFDLLTLEDNSTLTMEDLKTNIYHPFKDEINIINQIVMIKKLDSNNIVIAYMQQHNPLNGSINKKNYHLALYNMKLGLFLYNIETNIKETMTKLFAVKNLVFMATTNALYLLKTDKLHRSQSLNKLIGISKYHGEQHKDKPIGNGKIARKHLGNKIKLNGFIPSLNKNASKYMMMEASDELFRNTINFLDPSYEMKNFAKDLGEILCAIENDDVKGLEESFENFKRNLTAQDSSHRLVPEYAANFCTLYKCVVQKILTWPSYWPREQIAFLIQRSLIPACFYELLIEKILHQNDFETVDIAFASLRDALNEKCIIKCLLHILDHPQEVPERIALSLMRNIIGYRGNCSQMAKILKYLTLEHSYRLMEYLLSLFTTTIMYKPLDQSTTNSLVQNTPADTSANAPTKQGGNQATDSIDNIIYWLTCILEAFYNQIIGYHDKSHPLLKEILTKVHLVLDIIEMSHVIKSHLSDVAEKIRQTQLQSSKRKFEDSSGAYLDTKPLDSASNYSIEVLYF